MAISYCDSRESGNLENVGEGLEPALIKGNLKGCPY